MKWPLLLPTLLPKPRTSRSEQLIDGVGRLLAKRGFDRCPSTLGPRPATVLYPVPRRQDHMQADDGDDRQRDRPPMLPRSAAGASSLPVPRGGFCSVVILHDDPASSAITTARVCQMQSRPLQAGIEGEREISPGDATTSGASRAAFKCSSHSELCRPHATVTALAASAETFSDRAATSYGSEGSSASVARTRDKNSVCSLGPVTRMRSNLLLSLTST
jgi:hypothetical protein